jgi:hypothetical protein
MAMELSPDCEIAQRFCDDVVLAVSCFKPNAPGRRELGSLRAMSERQLLKSRGSYFAERVLLAVTPLEVVAIAMDLFAVGGTRRRVWKRSELRVQTIPSRAETHVDGPALLLSCLGSFPVIEIAPIADDDATFAVMENLLSGGRHHV